MAPDGRILDFEQFWPFYVSQHSRSGTRALHFGGTTFALLLALSAVVGSRPFLWPWALVAGYGFASIGHVFIEKNRPATFTHPLWSFMGGPFEGKYRNASVLHDVAYDQKNHPPAEVDRMFYSAMRCSGVGPVESKTMYYALLRFGRHWKFTVKKAKPVLPDSSRDLVNGEPRTTTIDPNEVGAIQQWIRQNNPTLDQIESRVDAKGR